MMSPTVIPIVVPLPSLGHREICVAGLARGHPDSGEAAIMGVPLPHLVAQNPLLMYPFVSLPLDLSSVWCVLAIWWTCLNVFALMWLHSCLVPPDGVTLWTCGSPKGTHHDGFSCVCCLRKASPFGCRPAPGKSTPSRCRALAHS